MSPPVFLGGMAGYTDLAYRMICRRLGAPYSVTEMMLDRMILIEKVRRKLVQIGPDDHPVAGQLIGNDPPVIADAAKELCKLGFDIIDLNLACPVRKALSRRRGGYLMSQPDQSLNMIRAVVAAVDRPVTLKMRRSFRESDKTNDDFWRIAEGAFDAGVAAICVHARSVEAKYFGKSNWEFLSQVKRRFPDRTILGSGDVLTPEDVLAMLRQTGVDGVAVARGALGNPWFFRQVADLAASRTPSAPTLLEQRVLMEDHYTQASELYGRRTPKIMRKCGIRYARLHPNARDVRVAFVAIKQPEHWRMVLDKFYTN